MLNVQKVSAQKTIMEKQHEVYQKEHLAMMVEMLNLIEKCHKYPKIEDFNIIGKIYGNNTFKLKVAKSLSIKDITPTLNTQEICATKVIQLI